MSLTCGIDPPRHEGVDEMKSHIVSKAMATALLGCVVLLASVAAAAPLKVTLGIDAEAARDRVITEIAYRGGGVARRTTVVGPRGGVYRRTTVARGAAVRPGWHGAGTRWARPGWYGWPVGGAIAAGAAIGVVSATGATAWAGAPPAPGMCWYYTDPSKTQGFWDYCR